VRIVELVKALPRAALLANPECPTLLSLFSFVGHCSCRWLSIVLQTRCIKAICVDLFSKKDYSVSLSAPPNPSASPQQSIVWWPCVCPSRPPTGFRFITRWLGPVTTQRWDPGSRRPCAYSDFNNYIGNLWLWLQLTGTVSLKCGGFTTKFLPTPDHIAAIARWKAGLLVQRAGKQDCWLYRFIIQKFWS